MCLSQRYRGGEDEDTYYSSWKDPSINKDFTPGHFFRKTSLICKKQEQRFHSDKNTGETAVRTRWSNHNKMSEHIDLRLWGRRRFLMPAWQSPLPSAGSQRTWCICMEAERKTKTQTRHQQQIYHMENLMEITANVYHFRSWQELYEKTASNLKIYQSKAWPSSWLS